jgi:ubiquitin-protein ligase
MWPSFEPSAIFLRRRTEKEMRALARFSSPLAAVIDLVDKGTIRFAVIGMEEPFRGELFIMDYTFSNEHPFLPPSVVMRTPIPGVQDGDLRIDMLDKLWAPSMTISNMIPAIQSLLNRRDLGCFPIPEIVRGEKTTPIILPKWHALFFDA